jgi:hypothetical protein
MGTSDVRLSPTRLDSADGKVRAEFDRFRRELETELKRLQASPFHMPPLPGVAYPGHRHYVPFGRVIVVDSAVSDVDVQLPTPTARDAGGFVGVVRLSSLNLVRCWAPSGVSIAGSASLSLPSATRIYLWYFTTIAGAGATFVPLNDA